MSKERRKYKRYEINIPVKGSVLRKDKMMKLTDEIQARTKDVSLSGMRLAWPKRWECKTCTRCLGWVFNFGCLLKRNGAKKINRKLDQEVAVNITINIRGEVPQKVSAKVIWTSHEREEKNSYEVGLNFTELDKKAERNLKELIKERH
jgi:c-di-GMP-binding flagellar brake protein YcgR